MVMILLLVVFLVWMNWVESKMSILFKDFIF